MVAPTEYNDRAVENVWTSNSTPKGGREKASQASPVSCAQEERTAYKSMETTDCQVPEKLKYITKRSPKQRQDAATKEQPAKGRYLLR